MRLWSFLPVIRIRAVALRPNSNPRFYLLPLDIRVSILSRTCFIIAWNSRVLYSSFRVRLIHLCISPCRENKATIYRSSSSIQTFICMIIQLAAQTNERDRERMSWLWWTCFALYLYSSFIPSLPKLYNVSVSPSRPNYSTSTTPICYIQPTKNVYASDFWSQW